MGHALTTERHPLQYSFLPRHACAVFFRAEAYQGGLASLSYYWFGRGVDYGNYI